MTVIPDAGALNTVEIEQALHDAAGRIHQQLGLWAAGTAATPWRDHLDPARTAVAAYLRATGRAAEAREVDAIGWNEPPPPTGFGRDAIKRALRGE